MEMMKMKSGDDDVGLDYWLQWQVPVCALIIILPSIVAVRLLINNNNKTTTTAATTTTTTGLVFWIPCWTKLNPIWLLLFRAFSFFSMSFILYRVVLDLGGLFSFYFYTQWTFALVTLYFALATVVSARGCWKLSKTSPSSHDQGQCNPLLNINSKAGFLEHSMEAIYQTCAGAVMLTDIVFWCLLLPFTLGQNFNLTLLIISTHSVNALFLILDSTFNCLPFSWHGMTYFVLWGVSYVAFQWSLHACGFTWWPYPFLDLSTPSAPLWYLALALVHVPCYGAYVLLLKAKSSIFSWLFPCSFVRSGSIMVEEGNVWDKKAS